MSIAGLMAFIANHGAVAHAMPDGQIAICLEVVGASGVMGADVEVVPASIGAVRLTLGY